ncbi:MAG: amidase [Naasia sp.]|uniref:amidase n=1 Tax=Naasia sp. TaxID=2546198 RepID=UPI002634E854|nr:amidase [Naasia sp.]MCU1569548.1 amidase [Naasia sp.]
MFELHHLSAQDQWDWLQRGDVSPVELTEHYLRRIEGLNPRLGAFSRVDGDRALDRARALERGTGELWGLPLAEKELWRRAGQPATGGSRALAGTVAETTDEIVRVLDDAGSVSLGATTAPEFGFPSYTEPLGRPPARNPYDLSLGAGGSSGGAAVAVAAGLLPVAPGSDGGGSIRIPAAATGLVGLKPSRGLVPAGAAADSVGGLVVPGPLARSVADAAMLLDAMTARRSGAIDYPRTLRAPDPGRLLGAAVRGEGRFSIGVTQQSPWDGAYEVTVSPEARDALTLALEALAAVGHGIEDASLPDSSAYPGAFRVLWQAGAAVLPLDDAALDRVEPLTAWLVRAGRALPAGALVEALTALGDFERALLRRLFLPEGARLDALLTPALALTPRPLGWYDAEDGERNFAQQVQYTPFTSFVNATGLPAITLPVTVTGEGLPMGVQLIGRPGGEATLVSIARQLERRFDWQRRHPPQW